jgi:uncharacterized protein YbjQ (UPF0145 family)
MSLKRNFLFLFNAIIIILLLSFKLMTLTTTPNIEGKKITEYLGVVTGETIVGANIFKDILAAVRDVVGGRSATYEKEIAGAREIALQEMTSKAEALGAHAIVGIDLDYETVGGKGSMLMVNVSGTAVKVE